MASFLSRMAAWNRIGSRVFADEMGFSLRRILAGERDAAAKLCQSANLSDSAVEEFLSWSGEILGDVRIAFRGEIFVSRALRSPIMRGCPACLRDDVEGSGRPPLEAMALRGDWQLRYVHSCLTHGRALVPLWSSNPPLERYDIGERLKDVAPEVSAGKWDADTITPTSFEIWLDRRLETGRDETEMMRFSFYASLETCRLFGTELLRLESAAGDEDDMTSERRALAAGFAVVSRGEEAIAAALEELTGLSTSGGHKAKSAFGAFYEALARDHASDPDFEPLRTLMREQILRTWPVAAGEIVLGEVTPKRVLHSVTTAAGEIGYTVAPLRKALVDAGALSPRDERPNGLATFDARAYAEFLKDLPGLIGFRAMADRMGASVHQFQALEREGILKPRISVPGFRAPWKASEGTDLVRSLLAGVQALDADERGWEPLHEAASRTRLGLRSIFDAIEAGQIAVGRSTAHEGYRSVRVCSRDIDRLERCDGERKDGRPLTIPEFERLVGMRKDRKFAALVADGLTPSTRLVSSTSGHERPYITADDARAFHERYVTASTLAKALDLHFRTVADVLRRAGVPRFEQASSRTYGNLYLRSDVAPVYGVEQGQTDT